MYFIDFQARASEAIELVRHMLQQEQQGPSEWHLQAALCTMNAHMHLRDLQAAVNTFLTVQLEAGSDISAELMHDFGATSIDLAFQIRETVTAAARHQAISIFDQLIGMTSHHELLVQATLERATTFHMLGDTAAAYAGYQNTLALDPGNHSARINIASIKQVSGDVVGAVEDMLSLVADGNQSTVLLNNLGTSLGFSGQIERGMAVLEQCLRIDPDNFEALINLGALYADDARIEEARALYLHAHALKPSEGDGLLVSSVILLHPIVSSLEQMTRERADFLRNVQALTTANRSLYIPHLDGIPRVPFYLTYDGLNNRLHQEAMARLYRQSHGVIFTGSAVQARDDASTAELSLEPTPIRVAFVSKFMGEW